MIDDLDPNVASMRAWLRQTHGELPTPPTCTRCGARPSVVTITAVRDGAVVQDRLCAGCAHAQGIDAWTPRGFQWDTSGEPWHVPGRERWARWVEALRTRVAALRDGGTPEERRDLADTIDAYTTSAEALPYGPLPPDLQAFGAEHRTPGGRGPGIRRPDGRGPDA